MWRMCVCTGVHEGPAQHQGGEEGAEEAQIPKHPLGEELQLRQAAGPGNTARIQGLRCLWEREWPEAKRRNS